MSRGFLKDVGGSKRMRIVLPGYDADNLNTPPNKVVFDSEDLGTLSLIVASSYTFPTYHLADRPWTQIASWNLSFVPLCQFQFRSGTQPYTDQVYTFTGYDANYKNFNIRVYKTGIWASLRQPANLTATIYYQAYRLAVTK